MKIHSPRTVEPEPASSRLTFAAALNEAMAEEMRRDGRVFLMATNAPEGLLKEFGPSRVRRTPISEAAFTGMAVGSAGCGMRPVAWWRNMTFGFVAFDQVINQAAKIRYMFGGQRSFPLVLRGVCGGGLRLAAQHSHTPYSIYAHIPGLKIIVPSDPADAKGLLKSAIRDDNPVVSFEAARLDGVEGDVPQAEHLVPLGVASVKRAGADVTVVALSYMVHLALQAAAELSAAGVSVEVVDPRTLVPLDMATIRASVLKTRRLVVVDEASPTCSMASEIAAQATEDREVFRVLQSPVRRVCALNVPVPYSPPLEDAVLPGKERIVAAIRDVLAD